MGNEYLLLSQWDEAQKQHINVKDGFELSVGIYDEGTENYAKDGVQITADGTPDFTIHNGAKVKCYDSKIQGFNKVTIGDGTANGGDTAVDILKCDMFNNNTTDLDHEEMEIADSRFYYTSDNRQDIGKVLSVPRKLSNVSIFQAIDGFEMRVSMELDRYKASDTTYDISIKDGEEVTLTNSSVDSSKLKRVV